MHATPRLLAALASITFASVATADLIEVVNPGEIQVNGTAGADVLVLGSLCDGSILIARLSAGGLAVGVIPAADVAANLIVVDAGSGNDTIDTSGVSSAAALNVFGGAGADLIMDGPGSNTLVGDTFAPGPSDGNDVIYGGPGNDVILPGGGFRDIAYGEAGDDTISDQDGVALASGGAGNDSIGVIFSAAWDNNLNPFDTRRIDHIIVPGGGDDSVNLIILGASTRVNIDGDFPASGAAAGTNDELFIQSEQPLAVGSSYLNFESVTVEPLP